MEYCKVYVTSRQRHAYYKECNQSNTKLQQRPFHIESPLSCQATLLPKRALSDRTISGKPSIQTFEGYKFCCNRFFHRKKVYSFYTSSKRCPGVCYNRSWWYLRNYVSQRHWLCVWRSYALCLRGCKVALLVDVTLHISYSWAKLCWQVLLFYPPSSGFSLASSLCKIFGGTNKVHYGRCTSGVIGHFFFLCPVTVLEVFAIVNSAQFNFLLVSDVALLQWHGHLLILPLLFGLGSGLGLQGCPFH